MSYTYLQAQGEESSAEYFSDIDPFAPLKLNPFLAPSFFSGRGMDCCLGFPSGTTCLHSTEDHGKDSLMCYMPVFPARESQLLAKEVGSSIRNITIRSKESFAKLSLDKSCWKTRQCLLFGDLETFSGIWPRWGSMRDGECFREGMLAVPPIEKGFTYLPVTPSGCSNHGKNHVAGRMDEWGGSKNPWRGTEIGALKLPGFEEWVMGWPEGWTEPTALEVGKFQQWLDSHGIRFQKD